MIISRTPFRIPIGGGGSDLPFYYTRQGGSLVTATIDKYMYIIVQPRKYYEKFFIRYLKNEMVNTVDEIEHEYVRESLKLLKIDKPVEITSISDVPAGTGLGSSSSFLVGLLHALHAYKGERVSKKTLAEEATQIQMEILKTPAGLQDQYAAAFGSMITLQISKQGKALVNPLDIHNSHLQKLEDNLLFFYTGILHSSTDVLNNQKQEAERDENKIAMLTEIKQIGQEIKKALENGNVRRFGEWLNIHWQTKRNLGSKMTNPQIDSWYDLALQRGAIGGKIMGAGGGGFFMFYVDNNQDAFRKIMGESGLKEVNFRFDHDGSKIIFNDSNL
jgi:D-glycero-alpha-D-manno-heptose-7-phosphate kinase